MWSLDGAYRAIKKLWEIVIPHRRVETQGQNYGEYFSSEGDVFDIRIYSEQLSPLTFAVEF